MPSKLVVPVKPYVRLMPNSRMPLASAPSTKYLSPASAERESLRRNAART
jgi:hypothetical protein